MEVVLLAIIPVVAAFSVWTVVDEVSGKAAALSQASGFQIDFGPSLLAMQGPLVLVACFTGTCAYLKSRQWLRRKLSMA